METKEELKMTKAETILQPYIEKLTTYTGDECEMVETDNCLAAQKETAVKFADFIHSDCTETDAGYYLYHGDYKQYTIPELYDLFNQNQ